MSSQRMKEYLNGSWQIAEARSRRYESGRSAPLPVLPEDEARMSRIMDAQVFGFRHSDRETAAEFPDVVERAVPLGFWEKIKP